EDPTVDPTVDPTEEPTKRPSAQPTSRPTAPPSAKPFDVYSTPGFHDFNGRRWYTECEPYSQTVRCRTEIWSTQVHPVGGTFVRETGWHFNNLSYLPLMKRQAWANNPLGVPGTFTSDD